MLATKELTRAQLRQLEDELVAERARLERSLKTHGAGDVAGALMSRAHARHAAILDALDRLSDGTYGVCSGCGERIPFERLLVMPEVTRCVTCGPRL